jgi:hypothetical protein
VGQEHDTSRGGVAGKKDPGDEAGLFGIGIGGDRDGVREGGAEDDGVGIAPDEKGIVLLAEEAGVLTGGDGAVGDDVRKGDGSGEFGSGGGGETIDDRTVGGEEFL